MTRKCEGCGCEFTPKTKRQKYCNEMKTFICLECGKEFQAICNSQHKIYCSGECARRANIAKATCNMEQRRCKLCGELFTPKHGSQQYCDRKHYRKCVVCGKEFELKRTSDGLKGQPITCSQGCATTLRFKNGNPFSDKSCREKASQTYLEKTGYDHPMHNPEVVSRIKSTYENRTGYVSPMHNPEVRKGIIKHSKISRLELRVASLLQAYDISYIHHYMINNGNISHEFDFYLPDYKILIDTDGVYFHSYLDDPDGKHVIDYYDEDRIALVPEGHRLHVIVEGQEEKDIKRLYDILNRDNGIESYDSELFKWCRGLGFPFPVYQEARMHKDYYSLCKYENDRYVPQCRLGNSIILNYHRSIWRARVGKYASPFDAWKDDALLKKAIANRLIYMNDVDPSKVLRGFNVSKICPRVSVFNPVLAKYLTIKYLSKYESVFDPFSGFSGRMLGVCSTGKMYIGQDINTAAVLETNNIIDEFDLMADVNVADTVSHHSSQYPCILTCPPYGKKEIYSHESTFLSCDEWIDLIMENYECKRYVFVIDETVKYNDNVVETISSTSHYNTVKELVVVIDRYL